MQRSRDSNSHDQRADGIFDVQAEMTQEFWGVSRDWSPDADRSERSASGADDTTGAIRAIRDGVTAFRPHRIDRRDPSGEVKRTRVHGASRAASPPASPPAPAPRPKRREATIGELAGGRVDHQRSDPRHAVAMLDPDEFWLDDDGFEDRRFAAGPEIPLTPVASLSDRLGVGAIDPLLARLGALVLVGVLLVPVALALRPSTSAAGAIGTDGSVAAQPVGATGVSADAGAPLSTTGATPADAAAPATDSATGVSAAPLTETAADPTTATPVAATEAVGTADPGSNASDASATAETAATVGSDESVGDVPQSEPVGDVTDSLDDAATADAEAERLTPECPKTYEAAVGDSWYRIADAAGISPSDLLTENSATVDTVILPGDDICLPSGATVPSAPSTTNAPSTTDAPSTTSAPATTDAPATTVAPTVTTPAGSPGRNASVDEVKAVIRSIFPESEWETAYTIASRESRYRPEAYNGWCCYGVFQIYYSVHKNWLDDLGVNNADDLYDPLVNTKAAYAIWQRAGNSWSPWSTYDG